MELTFTLVAAPLKLNGPRYGVFYYAGYFGFIID